MASKPNKAASKNQLRFGNKLASNGKLLLLIIFMCGIYVDYYSGLIINNAIDDPRSNLIHPLTQKN